MTDPPEPTPEDAAAMGILFKMVAGGGLAALGAAGGPAGLIVSSAVLPPVLDALDSMSRRYQEKLWANRATVVLEACTIGEMELDDLVDALTRDSKTMNLMAEALRAASETSVEEKLGLFAQVLANAATDAALVDEELILVRAIRSLESLHIRAAAILAKPPQFSPVATKPMITMWSGAFLAMATGWTASSVSSVLLTLQAAGVVYLQPARIDGSVGSWAAVEASGESVALADMACELTAFGRNLLNRITRLGDPT